MKSVTKEAHKGRIFRAVAAMIQGFQGGRPTLEMADGTVEALAEHLAIICMAVSEIEFTADRLASCRQAIVESMGNWAGAEHLKGEGT